MPQSGASCVKGSSRSFHFNREKSQQGGFKENSTRKLRAWRRKRKRQLPKEQPVLLSTLHMTTHPLQATVCTFAAWLSFIFSFSLQLLPLLYCLRPLSCVLLNQAKWYVFVAPLLFSFFFFSSSLIHPQCCSHYHPIEKQMSPQ